MVGQGLDRVIPVARGAGRILSAGRIGAYLSFLVPFGIYLLTLAPDLGTIDSGELAAVCARLQIAHPTGYPLYALLGRIATLSLPAPTPIARLNLLSAILAAASCLAAYVLFVRVIAGQRPKGTLGIRVGLALGGALLWGIHPALWHQAVGNEVHTLQAAMVAILLALSSGSMAPRGVRHHLLIAYGIGLTAANHLTVIYLIPGFFVAVLIDRHAREVLFKPRAGILLAAAFLIPLTLYLYLPIRAHVGPLLNWGDPTNVGRFFRHVGAAQYRVWLFASGQGFAENLRTYLLEITSIASLPVLAAAGLGLIALARRDLPCAVRLALGFIVGTLWASGYEIHDLEPYYLVSRLCLAALAIAGVAFLLPSAGTKTKASQRLLPGLIVIPFLAFGALTATRWPSFSRRGDRYVRLYVEDLLDRLPSHAIVLSRHWDMVVSPLLYIQQVEQKRPDVTIVDTELLRRSWYFPELRKADPALLAPIEDRVTAFLAQLRLFEAHRPYDARVIEERYRAVISGIFESHRSTRPIYHTPDVETTFYGTWSGIPEALAVRVVERPGEAPRAEPLDPSVWARQAGFVNDDVRANAWDFIIKLARGRILYLDDFGRTDEAATWREAVDRFQAINRPALR